MPPAQRAVSAPAPPPPWPASLTKATRSQAAWEPSSGAAPESAAAEVRVASLTSHGFALCGSPPRLGGTSHRAVRPSRVLHRRSRILRENESVATQEVADRPQIRGVLL